MPCPKPFCMNKPPGHSINPSHHSTEIRLARASALVFKPPSKSTSGTEWVPVDRATRVTGMKTEPQQCHCHRLWAHSSACRLYLPYTSFFRQVSKSPAAHQPLLTKGTQSSVCLCQAGSLPRAQHILCPGLAAVSWSVSCIWDSTAARLENRGCGKALSVLQSRVRQGSCLRPVGKEESSLTSFVPLVFSIIIKPLPPCLEMAEHLSTLLCHFHTVPSASALGNAQECAGRGSRACQACVQCLAAHAKV